MLSTSSSKSSATISNASATLSVGTK
ncbi:unnamed protein product, partial [Rotaria magnacalcarata]